MKLITCIQKTYASQNKRNRKTKTFDYEGEDAGCTRALEDARESFCIGTYLPIIDSLIAEVRRQKSVYCILQQNFNFLLNLNTWAISDIENAASCKLLKVYANDLDSDFPSEVVHFTFLLHSSPDLGLKTNTAQAQLSYLKKNCLIETFPNVAIILRIYLTLLVANTEGERSFSALKRVKNYLRSSLTQDHVCIIAIEKSFTKSMSFEDIIDKFAAAKCNTLFALAFFCGALSVLFITLFFNSLSASTFLPVPQIYSNFLSHLPNARCLRLIH